MNYRDEAIAERPVKDDLHRKRATPASMTQAQRFIHEHRNGSEGVFITLSAANNQIADNIRTGIHDGIICHNKINNVRFLNKYFERINQTLRHDGLIIGTVETQNQFKSRIRKQYPFFFIELFFSLHFVFKRVLPKVRATKRLYFYITKGKRRAISLTEVLGRLVSCGFEILSHEEIDGLTYFAARKAGEPRYDMAPTYGPLVQLKRIGKNGKLITIRKFRTMHPYSEYLQDYMFRMNNLQDGGKINGDMRVTGWGRIMRKLWLDEQPMWWNFLKCELKLVGVRPLSRHYFSLYPEEMQELRKRHKPGLIPPFYRDLPKTFEEIVDSERRYLEAYEKRPIRTDITYLFAALYNIFIKRARSN